MPRDLSGELTGLVKRADAQCHLRHVIHILVVCTEVENIPYSNAYPLEIRKDPLSRARLPHRPQGLQVSEVPAGPLRVQRRAGITAAIREQCSNRENDICWEKSTCFEKNSKDPIFVCADEAWFPVSSQFCSYGLGPREHLIRKLWCRKSTAPLS